MRIATGTVIADMGRLQPGHTALPIVQELVADPKALPADTRLHIDLAGRDPDDGMTSVPYDKGANFLRLLENHFGRARFDAFLRGWFDSHRFQSVTTETFVEALKKDPPVHPPRPAYPVKVQQPAVSTGQP